MTSSEGKLGSSSIGIQWKGTAACFNLHCPECAGFTHYCVDMPFPGSVRCSDCQQVWILSHDIAIRKANPADTNDQWRMDAAKDGHDV